MLIVPKDQEYQIDLWSLAPLFLFHAYDTADVLLHELEVGPLPVFLQGALFGAVEADTEIIHTGVHDPLAEVLDLDTEARADDRVEARVRGVAYDLEDIPIQKGLTPVEEPDKQNMVFHRVDYGLGLSRIQCW